MPNRADTDANTNTDADADQQSWTVIVREGCVFRRYRTDQTSADARERLLVDLCGGDLDVYEVHPPSDPPPEEGRAVDPVALGWTSLSQRTCRSAPPGKT